MATAIILPVNLVSFSARLNIQVLSGTVTNSSGSPLERTVKLVNRRLGEVIHTQQSQPDGSWSMMQNDPNSDSYSVYVEGADGLPENAEIFDKVTLS